MTLSGEAALETYGDRMTWRPLLLLVEVVSRNGFHLDNMVMARLSIRLLRSAKWTKQKKYWSLLKIFHMYFTTQGSGWGWFCGSLECSRICREALGFPDGSHHLAYSRKSIEVFVDKNLFVLEMMYLVREFSTFSFFFEIFYTPKGYIEILSSRLVFLKISWFENGMFRISFLKQR